MSAQLAVLLAGVAHPLDEALLVDPLDAARADARVEEGTVGQALRAAHPADVRAAPVVVHHCKRWKGGNNLTHERQKMRLGGDVVIY